MPIRQVTLYELYASLRLLDSGLLSTRYDIYHAIADGDLLHDKAGETTMKIFNKTLIIAMALPLALGSMSAFASQDHHGNMKKGHHGGKIFSQLDLTATQKQEMKTLRQANRSEYKAQRVENRQAMKADQQQLDKLVLASNFDESAVRAVAEKMSQQQVERRVAMLEQRHKMLNILTPEQKQKYVELKQQQSEKHFMRLETKKDQ